MKLVWSPELALKSYMDTIRSCEKFKEAGVPKLLSAMAIGWNTKFILESWSCGGSVAESVGLAIVACNMWARHFLYLFFLFAFSLLSTAAVVFTVASLWHLASVISVLEPFYGLAAMKKSYQLLKGKLRYTAVLVSAYLVACEVISSVFSVVVVHGGEDYGVFTRIMVGGFLVELLMSALRTMDLHEPQIPPCDHLYSRRHHRQLKGLI
ncbi:hypothetical protein HKD37_20G057315 [Glycine soja]|uniref:uncharacterized protein n=1 Tax=Glycine max TaxID=3847 RepID=UPI000719322D|nr:uncharacterized protein LOC106797704 [Glycine max]KAH1191457.1 hypothetical protein GmHk_20G058721 [Glycine max]|eukprot:XP_014628036.1 uncharacterized protein LOC106797704 [Glycine max]